MAEWYGQKYFYINKQNIIIAPRISHGFLQSTTKDNETRND